MHVLYLHQYFCTRGGSTGARSYEFARRLVRKGHAVTMITSGIDSVDGLGVPAGRKFIEIPFEGINVVPIRAAYNNPLIGTGMGGVTRMRHFLKFARLAARVGQQLQRPDVVFASHTPLTIGIAGSRLARHFDVPFVFEVRDLWPEALVRLGVLKNRWVIAWMRRLERRLYAAADHIVALSEGMKAGIVDAGVEPERVTVITNGCDLDLFRPDLDGSAARQSLNLGDRFTAIYFGAMGVANGLNYVLDAAAILKQRGRGDIAILLQGDGGQRAALQQRVRDEQLDNVLFNPPVPREEVARIVAACNACLVVIRPSDDDPTWSPNKMFDAFSAGKPVLINVPGSLGRLVVENGCGSFVDPYKPAELADALIMYADHPELSRQAGAAGRQLAEREFSREELVDRLEQVFLDAIQLVD